MRFPLVLSLTVALCLVSLFSGDFVHPIYPAWLEAGVFLEDLKQLLSVAKSTFLSWLGIAPLHKPYGLIGMDVAPEDLKPAESSFAECPKDMCLPNRKTCDGMGMDFAPEDPNQAFEIAFAEAPRSIGFPKHQTCDNVRMDFVPEDLQQTPIAAKTRVTIAPGSIALHSPPTWTSMLMDSIPDSMKQLAVVTHNMCDNLPCHLSHLWDYLVQVDKAELIRKTLWFMGPPWVTQLALRLWRYLRTPVERQVAGTRAPSAIRN